MPNDRLAFQLDKARQSIAEGKLAGVIILGDREIAKHPEQAAFVRDYLARHFRQPSRGAGRAVAGGRPPRPGPGPRGQRHDRLEPWLHGGWPTGVTPGESRG